MPPTVTKSLWYTLPPNRRAQTPLKTDASPHGLGFRVEGLGFRGLGFRVEGLGFRGLGFRVEGLGFRGLGFRV